MPGGLGSTTGETDGAGTAKRPEQHAQALSYLYHNHLAPPEIRVRALPSRYVDMDMLERGSYDPRAAYLAGMREWATWFDTILTILFGLLIGMLYLLIQRWLPRGRKDRIEPAMVSATGRDRAAAGRATSRRRP